MRLPPNLFTAANNAYMDGKAFFDIALVELIKV